MEDPRVGLIVGLVIQVVCDLEDMGSTMVGTGQVMCHLSYICRGVKSWEKSALLPG